MVLLKFFGLALCASAALANAATTEVPGTPYLVAASPDEFKPQIVKGVDEGGSNQIAGLLEKRAQCPGGYGDCSSIGQPGRCCPIGGQCCTRGGCCNKGYWCYSSGCCSVNENGCEGNSCCAKNQSCCRGGGCCNPGYYCAQVGNKRGCCPNGKTCTAGASAQGASGGECATPEHEKCAGEDFCCPSGSTCFRDSDGKGKCKVASA